MHKIEGQSSIIVLVLVVKDLRDYSTCPSRSLRAREPLAGAVSFMAALVRALFFFHFSLLLRSAGSAVRCRVCRLKKVQRKVPAPAVCYYSRHGRVTCVEIVCVFFRCRAP